MTGWARYTIAATAIAAAAALRWRLGVVVHETVPMALFYPAISVTTWLCGLGPGLVTVLLGAAVGSAFFTTPPPLGSPQWLAEGVRLGLFVFVGVLLAMLVEAARRQGERAESSERAAQEAEQKWRSLLENTADTIAIAGRDGRIEMVNRPPEWAGGDDVAGTTLFDHVEPEHHAVVQGALDRVFTAGESTRFEAVPSRPHANGAWIESRLVPIRDQDGGVRAALVVSSDATERRRSEEALRQSEAQFRGLFESSLDATAVMDDEGRLMDVNPAACALFGLPAERLAGMGLWEFSGSRAAFDATWARFLTEGQMRGEWELALPDGGVREVELSARARVLPGRHLSVMRDIGERRRAQRASAFVARATRTLAASLEERETARALADVIVPELADWCGVDIQDETGALSRIALAATDTRREDLAWQLARYAPPDGLGGARLGDVLRTGEPWLCPRLESETIEAVARDPDHLRLLVSSGLRSAMIVPLVSRGRPMGALWLAGIEPRAPFGPHELSLARELAERAGVALENARLYREAQQANRVKDEFLATLSHELRTPLNAIVGWTHLLRTGGLDLATSQRALETIERNARLQSQLIADILDVSRIVSGKLRIESAPVDLRSVMAAAVDAVRPMAEAKGLRLVTDVASQAAMVLGDAGRLLQIAQNLLQNAVKFSEKGGEVRARLRRTRHAVELVVEDTGIGIPPELLPHVFERFRQADSSTTRPHGGLGLGLAITRHLVEAHGGSVEAASQGIGTGASFTVRLPVVAGAAAGPAEELRPSAMPAPAEETRPSASPAALQLGGVRVLVVDAQADAHQLGIMLERAGASVARAASSAEAFAALARFRPHVIVTGLGLGDEEGFALMARVRSLPAEDGGGIPAIAVAAHAQAEEMARALRAGFQRQLAGPVDPVELAAVVAQLARPADPRALD